MYPRFIRLFVDADISPLLAKSDDPKMAEDPGVLDVVAQLDKACTEAGFFYVVILPSLNLFFFLPFTFTFTFTFTLWFYTSFFAVIEGNKKVISFRIIR